ncbi:hypothetical protein U7230_06900 [Carboxydochorda subterranea]|uniref:Spore coat protein n=1 Tax=Carboxydichorda subterranea TaxID=3109565 RepID=A0ABZ1C0U1_9FIRM|nr:hypothetical protein [Limnochorda sp. L945t]WRP18716.1 hypothetical protein U7230_06900 [Limnochorda sp. L945t]
MAHLTMMELDTLRHFIGEERLAVEKLNLYVQNCRDPELRNHLQHLANECNNNVQKLLGFLG